MLLLWVAYLVLIFMSFVGGLGQKKGIWVAKTVLASVIAFSLLPVFLGTGDFVAILFATMWGYIAYMNWHRAKQLS